MPQGTFRMPTDRFPPMHALWGKRLLLRPSCIFGRTRLGCWVATLRNSRSGLICPSPNQQYPPSQSSKDNNDGQKHPWVSGWAAIFEVGLLFLGGALVSSFLHSDPALAAGRTGHALIRKRTSSDNVQREAPDFAFSNGKCPCVHG